MLGSLKSKELVQLVTTWSGEVGFFQSLRHNGGQFGVKSSPGGLALLATHGEEV